MLSIRLYRESMIQAINSIKPLQIPDASKTAVRVNTCFSPIRALILFLS